MVTRFMDTFRLNLPVDMLPPHLQSLYNPSDFLYHPLTEDDIVDFIQYAAQNNLQIRVRGASQSKRSSVYTDNYDPINNQPSTNINLQLDQIRSVSFDDTNLLVTAGAGCNLGFDPFDPSMTSTEMNGLLPQVAQHGWVIPNVPAVIHQTVAGFLATGSSGGSLTYSFDEQIVAIRLVDGTGTITTYQRTDDLNDRFYAIGSSMGLLGVIVAVTIKCLPNLDNNHYKSATIVGYQTIGREDKCAFDFRGPGNGQKPSLKEFFQQKTYARLLWWPYPQLRSIVTWYADPMSASDEEFVQQGPNPYTPPFPGIIPGLTNWRLPAQVISAICYWLVNNWPNWFDSLTSNYADESQKKQWNKIKNWIEKLFPLYYPKLVTYFFSSGKGPQHFWDVWWQALAMDTVEFSTNLFDLDYAEIWVDIAHTQTLINVLDDYCQTGGLPVTGAYTVEVCSAKQSDFWLSPAYGYDVVRINFMAFANGLELSDAHFRQFWKLLYQRKINFRPHWGKMLPPSDGPTGSAYLASVYPKWTDFMQSRLEMDPQNIFLTRYWKDQLGV